MKIYTRLLGAFAIVILLSVLLGIVGIVMTSTISSQASEIYDNHVVGMEYLSTAERDFIVMRVVSNRAGVEALAGNTKGVNEKLLEFDSRKEAMDKALTNLDGVLVTETGKNLLNAVRANANDYMTEAKEYFAVCLQAAANANNAANTKIVSESLQDMSLKAAKVEECFTSLVANKTGAASDKNKETDIWRNMAILISIVLIVIIGGFSAFIAIFISGGIEKNLNDIISRIMTSSGNIYSSVAEFNAASENLAIGASKQAAAIEETSATMNETASMVSQNAENTRIAAQIAENSTKSLDKTGKHMTELVNTINELKESSGRVGKIVKTIDEIAFQTNLLAINATVEAARAGGDSGRSFAVVAQEVRSLAQRSADASRETADIIEKNISLTNSSRAEVEQVLMLTKKDAQDMTELNKLISEINAASEEQASGIKQINIAVSQMEKVTQENAAVAEENAAASNSMKNEIINLEDAVDIAKSIIRKSDETIISNSAGRGYEQRGTASRNISRANTYVKPAANLSETRTGSKTSGTAYKTSGTSGSSTKTEKHDAEKIIPLDDKDDF